MRTSSPKGFGDRLDAVCLTICQFASGGSRSIGLKSGVPSSLRMGMAAHVLELDDGHRRGMIHLGASIVSTVLEVAKNDNLKSGAVLRGIVMGYEVAVRCARAIQPGHKVYVL